MNESSRGGAGVSFRQFAALIPYFACHRRQYIAGLICLAIVDAAQIFIPQWTRRAINLIQQNDFRLAEVLMLCGAMVGTMAFIGAGRFLWRYFIHGASRRIETELRDRLFAHLLTLDAEFYQKNKTGDLMARSTNDIGAIRMAIGWGIVAGIDGTMLAAGILIVIFLQAPAIAAHAVIPIPFITLLIVFFGRAVGRRFKRAQEAYSKMSEIVQESFAGVRVIKSFVREEVFISRFSGANDDFVRANMAVVRVHGCFFPLILFLSGLATLIVLYSGGRAVARGEMMAGDLVSLLAYIQMLVWPMFGAGFTVNMIQRGAVSMTRINEILNTMPKIHNGGDPPPRSVVLSADAPPVYSAAPPAGAPRNAPASPILRIDGLTFAYPEGKSVIKDINLSVMEGEWLGIFGRTGSGKSTLVKLLPRLLDAPASTVFIKGCDVRDWPLAGLRALFGMAPQESFLFSDTIANNIIYGIDEDSAFSDSASPAIRTILSLAALERDILQLNEGLQTTIGERGLTLSGGQKQRVTIARAAIINPAILILDDSLSACDAETEKTILKNLRAARHDKTTIIISHRVSAFRNVDNIAVLEDGMLAEYGSPAALLDAGAVYAKTARLQQLAKA
ncbi:MAG: ABC transporter ATP-binding protein/permease [Spirochaetaceae bacterium]|jgi:ATP-binding cassette subfamily B protein|nr:ABC transporter ATP-binding protein/permease [Spirochaetaceae bacterium]